MLKSTHCMWHTLWTHFFFLLWGQLKSKWPFSAQFTTWIVYWNPTQWILYTAYFLFRGIIYLQWNAQPLSLLFNQCGKRKSRYRTFLTPHRAPHLTLLSNQPPVQPQPLLCFHHHELILLILEWDGVRHPITFHAQLVSLSMLFLRCSHVVVWPGGWLPCGTEYDEDAIVFYLRDTWSASGF
jgi:hypothetical protein